MDNVGDAAIAIDGGFEVAIGAVGGGGGGEVTDAFVALGFELVVVFGEFGKDAEGVLEMLCFDEIGNGLSRSLVERASASGRPMAL